MKMLDEHLPGRSTAEEKALAPFLRALKTAENKRTRFVNGPRATTAAGRRRQLARRVERLPEFLAAIEKAIGALEGKLEALAIARAKMLPKNATNIQIQSDGDRWDDRRYHVMCISDGTLVSLGGCPTLGPAQQREDWFRREAKRRTKAR